MFTRVALLVESNEQAFHHNLAGSKSEASVDSAMLYGVSPGAVWRSE